MVVGGHNLGKILAKQLGITFYDKELITLVAGETNFSEDFISENEQKLPNSLLYQMIMQDYEAPLNKSMSYDDALFVAQSRIIRRIASEKPCIIVGRCADYILKDRPNTINVFLYANMEFKINRVINEYGVSSDKALETIKQTD
ncbi:cytidylate kinase-like family protein, partial [Bacteroides caecigallinarum]